MAEVIPDFPTGFQPNMKLISNIPVRILVFRVVDKDDESVRHFTDEFYVKCRDYIYKNELKSQCRVSSEFLMA